MKSSPPHLWSSQPIVVVTPPRLVCALVPASALLAATTPVGSITPKADGTPASAMSMGSGGRSCSPLSSGASFRTALSAKAPFTSKEGGSGVRQGQVHLESLAQQPGQFQVFDLQVQSSNEASHFIATPSTSCQGARPMHSNVFTICLQTPAEPGARSSSRFQLARREDCSSPVSTTIIGGDSESQPCVAHPSSSFTATDVTEGAEVLAAAAPQRQAESEMAPAG